jgi:hypothetical protein
MRLHFGMKRTQRHASSLRDEEEQAASLAGIDELAETSKGVHVENFREDVSELIVGAHEDKFNIAVLR